MRQMVGDASRVSADVAGGVLTPEARRALCAWLCAGSHGPAFEAALAKWRAAGRVREFRGRLWALASARADRLRAIAASHGEQAALVALVAAGRAWPSRWATEDLIDQADRDVACGTAGRGAPAVILSELLLGSGAPRPDAASAEVVERDGSGRVVLRGCPEVPAWTRLSGVEPWMAEAGRRYGGLVEMSASVSVPSALGRVDCSRHGGGGGADARLRRGEMLAACDAAIGDGEALSVRRPARVAEGEMLGQGRRFGGRVAAGEMLAGRRAVTRRALARGVLVEGRSLAEVLAGHGWATKGDALVDLRGALVVLLGDLADALGRRA